MQSTPRLAIAAPTRVQSSRSQRQPRADEFVDLDASAEQAGAETREPRRRSSPWPRSGRRTPPWRTGAGCPVLLGVRRLAAALLERRRADADHRADVVDEAILAGPVVLRDRPGVRPGAEEQLQKPPLEEVDEARKGVVVAVVQPAIGLVGGRRAAARPAARTCRESARSAAAARPALPPPPRASRREIQNRDSATAARRRLGARCASPMRGLPGASRSSRRSVANKSKRQGSA